MASSKHFIILVVVLLTISGCFWQVSNRVNDPYFVPSAGEVDEGQTVSIMSDTEGAEIRYTTDGSTPDETSILYSGPITLTEDIIIKAIAFEGTSLPSNIVTAEYTISSGGVTASSGIYRTFSQDPTSSGSTITVTLKKVLQPDETTLLIEEMVPPGFTIENAGTGSVSGNTIRWAELTGATSGELTYTIVAPGNSGTYDFEGSYSINGGSIKTISGDLQLGVN